MRQRIRVLFPTPGGPWTSTTSGGGSSPAFSSKGAAGTKGSQSHHNRARDEWTTHHGASADPARLCAPEKLWRHRWIERRRREGSGAWLVHPRAHLPFSESLPFASRPSCQPFWHDGSCFFSRPPSLYRSRFLIVRFLTRLNALQGHPIQSPNYVPCKAQIGGYTEAVALDLIQ